MKICFACKIEKSNSEFNIKNKLTRSLQSSCKECHKKYAKDHYNRNKTRHNYLVKERKIKVRSIIRNYLNEYLSCHPCVDCGETNIIVLEFDHIDGSNKIMEVTKAVAMEWDFEKIDFEISKCEIRCANCHKIRHHNKRFFER